MVICWGSKFLVKYGLWPGYMVDDSSRDDVGTSEGSVELAKVIDLEKALP